MHRRKDLYGDDADNFCPERWEGDKLANIGWGFLPFLGGPRLCLGSKGLYLVIKSGLKTTTLTVDLVSHRGLCAHGSLVYSHSHPADISEHTAAAESPYRAHRTGTPESDYCGVECGWL